MQYKRGLRFGTLNVQTKYQKGKLDNIRQEVVRMDINILALSEVRWKGAGEIKTQDYSLMYYGGEEHRRGEGLLLSIGCSKAL